LQNDSAYQQELILTRKRLSSLEQEYATSEQELLTANEEMLSMNEELQSSNEELETSREELQSINEELETINAELTENNRQLIRANSDMKNLLESTDIATLFLDENDCVRLYTPELIRLFGVQERDIGRSIHDLARKVEYPDLADDAETVRRTLKPIERELRVEANDETFQTRVSPYRTLDNRLDGVVITFIEITTRKRNEQQIKENQRVLREQYAELETLYGTAPVGLSLVDRDLRYLRINERLAALNGLSVDDHIGKLQEEILPEAHEAVHQIQRKVLETGEPEFGLEVSTQTPAEPGKTRDFILDVYPVRSGDEIVAIGSCVREVTEEKELERQIVESAVRQGVALDAAGLGIFEWDMAADEAIWENDRMFEIFGRAPADGSLSFEEFEESVLHPDDNESFASHVKASYTSGRLDTIIRIRRADGEERFLQYYARVDQKQDGTHRMTGVVSDVTDKTLANQREDEQRRRVKTATNVAKLGIWEFEVGAEKIFMDEQSCEIYGVNKSGFAGTTEAWVALLHPDDRDFIIQRIQAFMGGDDSDFETQIRSMHPELGERILQLGAHMERDIYGELQRMVGVVRDVTEKRTYEQRLREKAQHIQAVIDNMFDCIVAIDASGTITSFNPAAEVVFGRHSTDAIGQNVSILMPKAYADHHNQYMTNYFSGAEPLVIGRVRELAGIRKNGEVFPMEVAVTEFQHSGEHGFVGVIRDLTERNRVERLQTEFVATVSHELRTPLTSIAGALALLKGGVAGAISEKGTKLLDTALRNSDRLTRLIEDLLDMERLTVDQLTFNFGAHPISTLLEHAIEANDAYAGRSDISLELQVPVPEVSIRVDDGRFVQILSNFLSNAVKFSPQGSSVIVEATLEDDDVLCTVTDFGSGVPDTFQERLFQKFSQIDGSDTRNLSGTGLGLAISKQLAINMNGSVGYAPAKSGGAQFWVRFPIVADVLKNIDL
jgi:PAS domain S-box-containing protein